MKPYENDICMRIFNGKCYIKITNIVCAVICCIYLMKKIEVLTTEIMPFVRPLNSTQPFRPSFVQKASSSYGSHFTGLISRK
jgi:hypothetical protein